MRLLLLLCLIFSSATTFTQVTIQNNVLASAGNSFQTPQLQLDMTLGEPFTKDPMNGTVFLTQGFHQPQKKKLIPTPSNPGNTVSMDEIEKLNGAVFPNPFTDYITIESAYFQYVQVFDIMGRVVYEANLSDPLTMVSTQHLGMGHYLVRLTKDDEEKLFELIKTVK